MRSLTGIQNDRDFTATFTAEYDNDKTAVTIIAPTSGTRLYITGVKINTEGASNAGESIRLFFNTSANTVVEWYPATTPDKFDSGSILIKGARNEVLSITTNLGNDKNHFVSVNYKEV